MAPATPQRGNNGGEGSYAVATQPVSAKRHGEIRQRLLEINPTHILGGCGRVGVYAIESTS